MLPSSAPPVTSSEGECALLKFCGNLRGVVICPHTNRFEASTAVEDKNTEDKTTKNHTSKKRKPNQLEEISHKSTRNTSEQTKKKLEPMTKLIARVIALNVEDKRVHLSLLPHLVQWNSFEFPQSCEEGLVIDAKVVHVSPKEATLVATIEGRNVVAYTNVFHKANISDDKVSSLLDLPQFKVGKSIKARVKHKNFLDGSVFVRTAKSYIEADKVSHNQFSPAEIVKGTVTSVKPAGVHVELNPFVKGFVQHNHLTDLPLSQAQTPNNVKVGTRAKLRVLFVDAARKKVNLTAKKTLINDTSPLVDVSQAEPNALLWGWLKEITDNSMIIKFFSRAEGIIPFAELHNMKEAAAEITKRGVGSLVRCRVMAPPAGHNRVLLSLSLAPREFPTRGEKRPRKENKDEPVKKLKTEKKEKKKTRTENISELRTTRIVEGTVVKHITTGTTMGLLVELPGRVLGHAHITEVSDEWVPEPLSETLIGKKVKVCVLPQYSLYRKTSDKLTKNQIKKPLYPALSLRQSNLLDLHDTISARPNSLSDLTTHTSYCGYVYASGPPGVFVSLSPRVTVRIPLRELRDEMVRREETEKLFPIGSLVRGMKVLTKDEGKCDCSLRSKATLQWSDLKVGDIVEGRIKKNMGEKGLIIRIDIADVDSICYSTEVGDDASVGVSSYSVGDSVKAKVIQLKDNRTWVTLKPSQVGGLECEEFEENGGVVQPQTRKDTHTHTHTFGKGRTHV
eukprot:GHVR01001475.1.p1 GENE.GHVR01001475.1~~GHVR01001475.1.p1  ORF type:complete len:734 (+),score=143.14 GHVR01001475.1:268-2469(+)